MAKRWARLEPHVSAYGPDDAVKRPTVLLFHGCGGVREHIHMYARAAAEAGYRAFVIDSFAARGWNRTFGLMFVCTGLQFQGAERAGDVLAAAWGLAGRADVDESKISLAGWSHGAWAIMDLMTMPLTQAGDAGLSDASDAALAGVDSLILVYPYGGFGALSRTRPWVRKPRLWGVIALHDHITHAADADRIYQPAIRLGAEADIWRVDGTHAFDEEQNAMGVMRYDEALKHEAIERYLAFLEKTLGAPPEVARRAS